VGRELVSTANRVKQTKAICEVVCFLTVVQAKFVVFDMMLLLVVVRKRPPKTRAGKKFLENRGPKLVENTKNIMFM
jgi:hypothetical protein